MVELKDTGYSFRIEGRVQGVGLRWWTQAVALEIGLRGWVRNNPDGSVDVHVAEAEGKLKDFERRLRDGPPAARVDQVRVLGPAEALPASGFEIRRA